MMIRITAAGVSTAILVFLSGCADPAVEQTNRDATSATATSSTEVRDARLGAFSPLPAVMESADNPVTEAKVTLGRILYYDARMSKNHDVSCNTCHLLDSYGVDGTPVSTGHLEQQGGRNAPTVYNAAGHLSQFWDGRAATVEDQAKGPPLNPIEMAMPDENAVVEMLKSIPDYSPLFSAAFPGDEDPITFDNFARAIGAFERQLVTVSRWDAYLAGNNDALSSEEKAGLTTFLDAGCATCHSGAYVGGSMYQKLGLVKAWPDDSDKGRFDATGNEADTLFFKVPSLRNITETGPYFHNGEIATLEGAVRLMADHQLGVPVNSEQVASIIVFLNTLTGEVDAEYIAKPDLPESGSDTPAPDPS